MLVGSRGEMVFKTTAECSNFCPFGGADKSRKKSDSFIYGGNKSHQRPFPYKMKRRGSEGRVRRRWPWLNRLHQWAFECTELSLPWEWVCRGCKSNCIALIGRQLTGRNEGRGKLLEHFQVGFPTLYFKGFLFCDINPLFVISRAARSTEKKLMKVLNFYNYMVSMHIYRVPTVIYCM